MTKRLAVLAALAVLSGVGAGRIDEGVPVPRAPRSFRESAVVFFDDMESGAPGWTHGYTDWPVFFHEDQYYAYEDGTPPDYSWWCGRLDPDYAGGDGYGNLWDARLQVPWIDWSGYFYPVLMFRFRNDTEPGNDFTYVQAESLGVYRNLRPPYDGAIAWTETGFYLGNRDNPAACRFRFVSDVSWSDEDGLYDSDGGAFACDEIQVFDYYTGTVFFYDDVEDGIGLCMPNPPQPSDSWHLVETPCRAASDPTCWSVGCWDTSYVCADIQDALVSPVVDISGAERCTLFFALHSCVPGPDEGDYWTLECSVDGGDTWIHEGAWWGDTPPPACDIFSPVGLDGVSIDDQLPASWFRMRLTMHTDESGCGPGASGAAGIFLDDVRVVVSPPPSPVQETTWGQVKAMFRK